MKFSPTSANLLLFMVLAGTLPGAQQVPIDTSSVSPEIEEAAKWVSLAPKVGVRYDYEVTAAVRMLLFWISRDDVGQGYIQTGAMPGNPAMETIELVMGSDPAKAPMGINRWGAASEVWRQDNHSGVFFGFMKASQNDSVGSAREEISKEKDTQKYQYNGIISQMNSGRAFSAVVPISSATDFTLHQLPLAQQMVLQELKSHARPPRVLDARSLEGCSTGIGFLFTVRELIDGVLDANRSPNTRCYVYHARRYMMTLKDCEPVKEMKVALKLHGASRKVERIYRDLKRADFTVLNTQSKERTDFEVVFGSAGELRGVPVQIEYQPSWWFRVTLNLMKQ